MGEMLCPPDRNHKGVFFRKAVPTDNLVDPDTGHIPRPCQACPGTDLQTINADPQVPLLTRRKFGPICCFAGQINTFPCPKPKNIQPQGFQVQWKGAGVPCGIGNVNPAVCQHVFLHPVMHAEKQFPPYSVGVGAVPDCTAALPFQIVARSKKPPRRNRSRQLQKCCSEGQVRGCDRCREDFPPGPLRTCLLQDGTHRLLRSGLDDSDGAGHTS